MDGALTALTVKGDVKDASIDVTGGVDGKIGAITIGGSLIGGAADNSGFIHSSGDMGAVKIGHDIQGGSGKHCGELHSQGKLASITLGGSIITGTDNSSKNQAGGDLTDNAAIRGFHGIGALTVKGGLTGNLSAGGLTSVIIIADGQAVPGPTSDIAIGKIAITGSVHYATILAGYGNIGPDNADAQIGAVTVGGDWIASSIAAGAKAGPMGFGAGDAINSGGTDTAGRFSKIASITIAGQVFGTPSNVGMFDQFGFVAEEIGALKIGGSAFTLAAGKHIDNFTVGQTLGDVHVHEI